MSPTDTWCVRIAGKYYMVYERLIEGERYIKMYTSILMFISGISNTAPLLIVICRAGISRQKCRMCISTIMWIILKCSKCFMLSMLCLSNHDRLTGRFRRRRRDATMMIGRTSLKLCRLALTAEQIYLMNLCLKRLIADATRIPAHTKLLLVGARLSCHRAI